MKLPKILVIDDDSNFTRLLKRAFSEHLKKYEICEVNNPIRALEAVCQFKPDLILMDTIMPPIDGLELASCFRSDYEFYRVPIVLMVSSVTRHQEEIDPDSHIIDGFPFIMKPITQQALIECIEANLTRRV